MEKLQGPITPYLIEEDLDVGWLEEFVNNFGNNYNKFEESSYNNNEESSLPSLQEEIPFLQMLQQVETAGTTPFQHQHMQQEPNYFQLLLKFQPQKMTLMENPTKLHELHELQSPVKPETGLVKEECSPKRPDYIETPLAFANASHPKERRKRKRPSKSSKNKEEIENQRMSHIAVERNRRRLMNDHLNALRSLMPPSYVQRGDQASIIGGAIDFVKEMEQMLQSLQVEKTMRQSENVSAASSSTSSSSNLMNNNMLVTSPRLSTFQFINNLDVNEKGYNGNFTQVRRNNNSPEEFTAEIKSALADIKVVVIQNHVNLKIQCQRRHGQLLKVILGFEELRLTILHLNITSLQTLVHYSFSLKIEDDCKLRSAEEVVKAVHHIFSLINLS